MVKPHVGKTVDLYPLSMVETTTQARGGASTATRTLYGPQSNFVGHKLSRSDSSQPAGDFVHPLSYQIRRERTTAPTGSKTSSEIFHGSYYPQPWDAVGNGSFGVWPSGRQTAPDASASDISACYDICISKLMSKLRGSGGNAAVDISEAHQTRRMLSNTRKFIARLNNGPMIAIRSRALRRKGILAKRMIGGRPYELRKDGRWHPVHPSSLAKMSCDTYLSYAYGWRPLFSSVFDALNSIYLHYAREDGVQTFTASHTMKVENSGQWSVPAYPAVVGPNRSMISIRERLAVRYDVSETAGLLLSRLTSLNPLLILWERIPYSFVVDWFVNVSGYLQTLETAFIWASRFRGGYRTSTWKSTLSSWVSKSTIQYGVYVPGDVWRNSFTAIGYSEITYKKREVLAQSPSPSKPTCRIDLGGQQMLSLVTLIGQRVPTH